MPHASAEKRREYSRAYEQRPERKAAKREYNQRPERKEAQRERARLRTPTYHSWRAMKDRCTNPNATDYARYGGRGITVCPEWLDSFETFLADMGERPEGTTLGRYGDEGNYEQGNVAWMTPSEQQANRRPRTKAAA